MDNPSNQVVGAMDIAVLWAFTWGAPNLALMAFAFVLTGSLDVFNVLNWPPYFQIASGGWFIISGIAILCGFFEVRQLEDEE